MRPRRRGLFARASMIAAWLIFWINALLFPCTAALAALDPGDCGTSTASVPALPVFNASQQAHAHADDGKNPDPLCCHVLSPVPGTLDAGPGLIAGHQPGAWPPVAVTISPRLLVFTRRQKFALRELPTPAVPLYLRTSRILS